MKHEEEIEVGDWFYGPNKTAVFKRKNNEYSLKGRKKVSSRLQKILDLEFENDSR